MREVSDDDFGVYFSLVVLYGFSSFFFECPSAEVASDAIMDRAILDRNQRSDSTIDAHEGPMTRARTKRFKEQLSLFMASFFKERGHPSESKTTCVHVIQAA